MPHLEHPDITIDDYMRDRFRIWNENRTQQVPIGYHTLTPMDASVKVQWVDALLSNEYGQVTGFLKVQTEVAADDGVDRFAYCCWGVLCEIEQVPSVAYTGLTEHTSSHGQVWEFRFDSDDDGTEIPPAYWTTRFGLSVAVVNSLAEANDQGYLFEEIAGWVEKYL